MLGHPLSKDQASAERCVTSCQRDTYTASDDTGVASWMSGQEAIYLPIVAQMAIHFSAHKLLSMVTRALRPKGVSIFSTRIDWLAGSRWRGRPRREKESLSDSGAACTVRCGARSSLCLHIIAFEAYFRTKELSTLDILSILADDGGRRSSGLLTLRSTVEEYRANRSVARFT